MGVSVIVAGWLTNRRRVTCSGGPRAGVMPGTGQSALSGGGGGRAVGSIPGQHRRGEGLASRVPSGLLVCTAGSSSVPPATASTSADGVLLRGASGGASTKATWPWWVIHANGRAGRWSGNGRLCPVPHWRAPMDRHLTLLIWKLVISGVFLQGGVLHLLGPAVQWRTGSVTGSWGRCCCLCIGHCSAVPAGLDCMGGGGGACLVGFWSWVLRLLKRLGRDSCTTIFPFAKYACFPWFLSCDKVSLCCFVRSAATRRPSLSRIKFFPSLSLIMIMASLHLWNLMITGRGLSDVLETGPKRWALSTSVSFQSFCGKCRRRVLINRAVHLSNDSPASSFIPYSSTFDRRDYRSCLSTSSSFLNEKTCCFARFLWNPAARCSI